MSGLEGDYVDTVCYAQIEPSWRYGDRTLAKSLSGASVVRLTQTHPRQPIGGTVLVRLALRIPASAFLPLQPPALVVPEGATEPILLQVVES